MPDDLRKVLEAKMLGVIPTQVMVCQVTSVDTGKQTCDVKLLSSENDLYDVRLSPFTGSHSTLVIIPKIGSLALVGIIENMPSANYLVSCQESDKILMRGDTLGGMVKINNLIKELNKNKAILDAILKVITGSVIPEPGNSAPSALQTALKGVLTGKQTGDYSDIENKKIVHA